MKKSWLWIFVIIGALMIISAAAIHVNRIYEQSTMSATTGTVVSVKDGCVLALFRTARGEALPVRASVCQSPPAYSVGDQVRVLYSSQNPANATLDSAVQNWFLTLLFGGIGLVFLMVGGVLVWIITLGPKCAEQRLSNLKRTGRAVQAQVMNVEPNVSVTLNRRSPWRIVAQWLNPEIGKVQLFYSQNLWFDPSPYLMMKELQVWLDPQRPKHHSLDTGFLPKMG